MDVLQAGELRIAYERAGRGPAVVFVHGAGDDARVWQPQLAALAGDFTVVAWDEPGAGRSSAVPAGFGLSDYADSLAALINGLGVAPAHLAGLSWGGTVVLELYRRHPELVTTLILADTYAGWRGSLSEDEVQARVATVSRMLDAPCGRLDLASSGMFAGDPPSRFEPLIEDLAAAVRPESLRTQLAAMAEADLSGLLPRITVPTLLIWGEADTRSPLTVADQFATAIPEAELVVIRGAGHMSNLERPERFNRAVRAFCRAHRDRGGRPAA